MRHYTFDSMDQIQKQLHIGGMTCINCQNKIEAGLGSLPGVEDVSVSYQSGTARLSYDAEQISYAQIEQTIRSLGYEVLSREERPDIARSASILAIIIALYVLLQRFGVLNLLVPSQLADSGMGYGALLVVGLLTSVHCVAMCGGIGLSQCLPQDGMKGGAVFLPSLLYNFGRVVSYTAVGFLLGLLGMAIGGSGGGVPILLQGLLKLFAGAVMVVMGINMLGVFPWLRRLTLPIPKSITRAVNAEKAKTRRPFVVGLLNGLMPCGPLQSMQILALASGNPLTGALSMLLFSLGTVPLMLGLGSAVSALGKRFARAVTGVGAVLVAVLGLAMLSQGGSLSGMLPPERLLLLVVGLALAGLAVSIPVRGRSLRFALVAAAVAVVLWAGTLWRYLDEGTAAADGSTVRMVDGVQVVNSTLSPGEYPTIMVQSGTPVRWVINAPAGSINGCNYRMIVRDLGLELSFEEGDNVLEFTPEKAGTIPYTCWMGMIRGSINVI